MIEPKVSVIVPVYNCEKYLDDCLNSIINQTLKDIEIICINDGSTDKSLEILESYAAKDGRICVLNQENKGIGVARNRGIKQARGTFIQFCDSDDMLQVGMVEYCYLQATEFNLDVFYFDAKAIFENRHLETTKSTYKSYYHRENIYHFLQTGAELFIKQIHDNTFRMSAPLQFIRRSFLLEAGILFPPHVVHEDNYFTSALMVLAKKVMHENKPMYLRRVRDNSIMTVQEAYRNVNGYFICARQLIELLPSISGNEELEYAFRQFICRLLRNACRIFLNIDNEEKEKIKTLKYQEQIYFSFLLALSDYKVDSKIFEQFFAFNTLDKFLFDCVWMKKVKCQELEDTVKRINTSLDKIENSYKKAQKNLELKNKEVEKLKQSIRDVKSAQWFLEHSVSFRCGRAITYVPRKVRDFLNEK